MTNCDPKSCNTCPSKDKGTKEEIIRCKLLRIKHKILVMSGKGGVGKSSVASYLSLAMAQKGYKVGLMDIDLHGPSIPKMFGIHGVLNLTPEHEILPHEYLPNLKIVSIESMMEDADSAVIWRGPLKHGVIQQFIADCKWDELDFLVIDCPPGTGDEPLSIARIIPEIKAIIVTTPQEVALADVRKSINFCRRMNVEILGLVENMSGLYCPHCKGFIPIFGTGGGEKTAERMKVPFLGPLPFEPAVVAGGDAGRPILEQEEESDFKKAITRFAENIIERLSEMEASGEGEAKTVH